MLLNSFIHSKKLLTDIPAVMGWYDLSLRSAHKRGNASANGDSGSSVYRMSNIARSDFVPTVWQGTDDYGPIPSDGNNTLQSLYSGNQLRWLGSTEYGKPYSPAAQNAANFPSGSTDGWIFTFLKIDYQIGYSGSKGAVAYGGTGSTGCRGLGVQASGENTTYISLFLNGSNNSPLIQHNVNNANNWVLVAGRYSAAQCELWINGVMYGTVSTTDPATTTEGLYFFRGPSTGLFTGEIGNVVITGALTTDERQFIEGVVAWKRNLASNLPSGHPWKDISPL